MKKITLILSLMIASLGYSQTFPLDYSDPLDLMIGYDGCVATIVQDAGAPVMQVVGGGQLYDNGQLVLSQNLNLADDANNTITFRVKPTTGTGNGSHLLKFENGIGGAAQCELAFTTTGLAWQTITLNFGAGLGNYSKMVLFTDFNNTLTGTYLFDDFAGGTNIAPPPPPAAPTTNAPVPTRLAANVKSVYSDSYSNIATNYNPNWGQSGGVNTTFNPTGTGTNFAMAYTGFDYQGTELTAQSLANMEFLHVDVWTNANPANSILKVSPINNGTGVVEIQVPITYTSESWSSVDIPKSSFTGASWDSVFQMKFAANGAGSTVPITIYLDNIYFWKAPVAAGVDATLSDLKVDNATVAGFTPSTITYTRGVLVGGAVPVITLATTNDTAATRVITQATSVPGSATVLVTSQNGSVTRTYTVNYVYVGPTVAAPTPPARPAADVISLFSNAYANVTVNTWSAPWDDSSIEDILVFGNATKKITFTNFLGVDFTGAPFDASALTHFHMDYWTDNTNLTGKVLNPKWSNHSAGAGETSSFLYTGIVTTSGAWVSIDVPLTTFTNGPLTRNALAQFLLSSNLDVVYVDNIYLHKNTLGTSSFEATKFKMYPNPASSELTIEANSTIDSISITNMLGQEVAQKAAGNSVEIIDISNLQSGVYFLKVASEGNFSTQRFVKK